MAIGFRYLSGSAVDFTSNTLETKVLLSILIFYISTTKVWHLSTLQWY